MGGAFLAPPFQSTAFLMAITSRRSFFWGRVPGEAGKDVQTGPVAEENSADDFLLMCDENRPLEQSLDHGNAPFQASGGFKKPLVATLPLQALSNKVHRPLRPSTSRLKMRDSINHYFLSIRDPPEESKVTEVPIYEHCKFEGVPITRLTLSGAAQIAAFQQQLTLSRACLGEHYFYYQWTAWVAENGNKLRLERDIYTSLQLKGLFEAIFVNSVDLRKCHIFRAGFSPNRKSSQLEKGKVVQFKAEEGQQEFFHELCDAVLGDSLYGPPIQCK